MTTTAPDSAVQAIKNRRKEIKREVQELRAKIDVLVAEEGDLDITERTLAKYSSSTITAEPEPTSAWDGDSDPDEVRATIPDMILSVVKEAYADGHRGVTGGEIFSTIRKKHKPDAKTDNIRPTVWRMVQRKRLKKKGKFYYPVEDAA